MRKREPAKRDPDILGGPKVGLIRKDRLRPNVILNDAQEEELKDAKAGRVEWVSPAVAAYMLGISTEGLKKRRQGASGGVVPEHKKHGKSFVYKWTSLLAQSAEVDHLQKVQSDLMEQVAQLREALSQERQATQKRDALFGQLLSRLGIDLDALAVMTLWATDHEGRLTSHAAVADGETWAQVKEGRHSATLTWMEALRAPWRHENDREPYHQAALAVLEHAREGARTPVGG